MICECACINIHIALVYVRNVHPQRPGYDYHNYRLRVIANLVLNVVFNVCYHSNVIICKLNIPAHALRSIWARWQRQEKHDVYWFRFFFRLSATIWNCDPYWCYLVIKEYSTGWRKSQSNEKMHIVLKIQIICQKLMEIHWFVRIFIWNI